MVVVCGEALVDLVPAPGGIGHRARPGGSPANVAVGLARLGVPAQLLARLATDHFGQMVRRHVAASGVDLSLSVSAEQPCTVAMVTVDATGTADYAFFVDATADDLWSVDDLPPRLPDRAALHLSGALALVRPGLRATVDALLDREAGRRVVSFDPNPRPHLTPDVAVLRTTLERWVARADLVKVSEEDLAWTYPGEPATAVARRWHRLGPSVVVVTRGAAGVWAIGPTGVQGWPAEPVAVVDTVGAGDAFTAGLLAALHRAGRLTPAALRELDADELDRALHHALRVAAITCTRTGADPPWTADLA